MSQSQTMRYEWNQLPWRKIQVKLFKLQRQIYRASQRGNVKLLHRLQRLLIKSWYARLLAVRRVTQDNRGRRTAGVDGVSCLSPTQRLNLVHSLRAIPKASPLRRVWIPKPGKAEQRPLGIPVMTDRAAQALVKLALEPEWEAKFEPNSYGFRPGRSCHDAIEAIFIAIGRKPKYVVDADIAGCFDHISHRALLNKLNTYPALSRIIKTWLKCGILENGGLQPTIAGTPQGGIISPLLANVALHGLETYLDILFPKKRIKDGNLKYTTNGVQTIRFADDFVVLTDIDNTQAILNEIQNWLKGMGLELKHEKTHISHTLQGEGFEFLGFQIRQYKVGKYRSKQGFKTLITPSRKSQKHHMDQLSTIVRVHKPVSQVALINHLNPVIRGWSNYYSTVVSKAIFQSLDHQLFRKLMSWAKYRHPNLNTRSITSKYWGISSGEGWVFRTVTGDKLCKHGGTPIVRHVKVRGTKSPLDGDWAYWAGRRGRYPGITTQVAKLLRTQQGKCAHCGLSFMSEDVLEVHHKDGDHFHNQHDNLALLHGHCHDQMHAVTQNETGEGKALQVGEEPDECKHSRPVLKPSR